MSSCCLTYADVDEAMLEDEIAADGVTASYYPQVLTGYNTGTTVRTPSEVTAVEVIGLFADLKLTAPEDTMARSATFKFQYSTALGFAPSALDRLEIGSFSYRATQVAVDQSGLTPLSYTLTLASD